MALGTIAFWLLLPVSFLGPLRAKMGLVGNRWFKRAHLLAYAAWPLATAHYVLAGTDALAEWSLGLLFAGTALIVMGLLARGFIPAPGPTRTVTGADPERLTSAGPPAGSHLGHRCLTSVTQQRHHPMSPITASPTTARSTTCNGQASSTHRHRRREVSSSPGWSASVAVINAASSNSPESQTVALVSSEQTGAPAPTVTSSPESTQHPPRLRRPIRSHAQSDQRAAAGDLRGGRSPSSRSLRPRPSQPRSPRRRRAPRARSQSHPPQPRSRSHRRFGRSRLTRPSLRCFPEPMEGP